MSDILTVYHLWYWTPKIWGRDDGAHCLPYISQSNTLREGETCECVKNIQTSPYTYTVGSCLFDSAMFCLLRSNYFQTIVPYINGPCLRALVYLFALTALTTEGGNTLSDMYDYYIDSRGMLMNTNQGVMDDDDMRFIWRNKNFTHYALHMQENGTEVNLRE